MSDLLYDGFLKIREVVHKGQKFEVMDRGNSVNVLIVEMGRKKHEDRFLLGAQYRAGVDRVLNTNVAGMVDPGETYQEAAVREILEESGYKVNPDNLFAFGLFANSPGGSSKKTLVYVAVVNNLDRGKPTDQSENIQWTWRSASTYTSFNGAMEVISHLQFRQHRKKIKQLMKKRGVLTSDNYRVAV